MTARQSRNDAKHIMLYDRKKTPITPTRSADNLVGSMSKKSVRRISQLELLSLREEEMKRKKRGEVRRK